MAKQKPVPSLDFPPIIDPYLINVQTIEGGRTVVTFQPECPVELFARWIQKMGTPEGFVFPVGDENDPDYWDNLDRVAAVWNHQNIPDVIKAELDRMETALLLGKLGFYGRKQEHEQ